MLEGRSWFRYRCWDPSEWLVSSYHPSEATSDFNSGKNSGKGTIRRIRS